MSSKKSCHNTILLWVITVSKRKYFPGPTITSIDDLMMCERVFHFDKVIHCGWFQNWNLLFTKKQLEANSIKHAIKTDHAVCMIALIMKNKVTDELEKIETEEVDINWENEFCVEQNVGVLFPENVFCTVWGKSDSSENRFFEVQFKPIHDGTPEDPICCSFTESDSIEELYEVVINTARKAFEIIYKEKKDA